MIPDTQMVMALVLAELQAEGKRPRDLTPEDMQRRINSAIADLTFAAEIVEPLTTPLPAVG